MNVGGVVTTVDGEVLSEPDDVLGMHAGHLKGAEKLRCAESLRWLLQQYELEIAVLLKKVESCLVGDTQLHKKRVRQCLRLIYLESCREHVCSLLKT